MQLASVHCFAVRFVGLFEPCTSLVLWFGCIAELLQGMNTWPCEGKTSLMLLQFSKMTSTCGVC